MRTASNLALTVVLLGASQQAPPQDVLRKQVLALAAGEAEAGARLEEVAFIFAGQVRSSAESESLEVRIALRNWLPHPVWRGVLEGTIGDVRRRERELLGEGRTWTLEALSRAGMVLVGREGRDRTAGLNLLERVPASDPRALLPFLDDPATARLAVAALGRADEALALKEALRHLREGPDQIALQMGTLIADLGSPDLTPELVDILKAHPSRTVVVVGILEKIGDARAEDVLIERLPATTAAERYGLQQALSLLGGPKAVAALRKYRDALPADDPGRPGVKDALARLRDPGLSRELIAAGDWGVELQRLGDRSVTAEVVERIKSGRLKVKERKAALELLGVIGSEAEVDLLLEHLKDGRFRESAAIALGELGEARTAGPLAEALATSSYVAPVARALARVPLEGAEGPLLELLGDPAANQGAAREAIGLAGRVGGVKVKESLSALVADPRALWALEAALVLGPLLEPGDRDGLRRRLPPKDETRRGAGALALALSGDRESFGACIRLWRSGRLGYGLHRENAIRLLLDNEDGLQALEVEVKAHPEWIDGAEALALRGRETGREPLLRVLTSPLKTVRNRAAVGLARLGHPAGLLEILENADVYSWEPEQDAVVAKAVDDAGAARLRFWAWTQAYHSNQMPARVLARRRDVELAPFFRKALRRDTVDNAVYQQSNTPALAEAMAAMGRAESRPTFLRLLRSRAPSTRALGARSLATLEGPGAIPALLPLLDDGEELPDGRRVREAVVDALEGLAGRTFQGSSRARVAAARAWAVK